MEEQLFKLKDMMASVFTHLNAEAHGLPKSPASSIIQQLEAFKANISQWAVGAVPTNTSAIIPDNVQEDFNQKLEELQRIFIPLISTVQGKFIEGVANLRESITPGIREIKELITESESAIKEIERS